MERLLIITFGHMQIHIIYFIYFTKSWSQSWILGHTYTYTDISNSNYVANLKWPIAYDTIEMKNCMEFSSLVIYS